MKHYWIIVIITILFASLSHAKENTILSLPLKFTELEKRCRKELKKTFYSYPRLGNAKVIDWKLLAWRRVRHEGRDFYYDSALSWGRVSTKSGIRWVLLQHHRNSNFAQWNTSIVYDGDNTWLLYFDYPPTNKDIYTRMTEFDWTTEEGWHSYDSGILRANWVDAIGESPKREFMIAMG